MVSKHFFNCSSSLFVQIEEISFRKLMLLSVFQGCPVFRFRGTKYMSKIFRKANTIQIYIRYNLGGTYNLVIQPIFWWQLLSYNIFYKVGVYLEKLPCELFFKNWSLFLFRGPVKKQKFNSINGMNRVLILRFSKCRPEAIQIQRGKCKE